MRAEIKKLHQLVRTTTIYVTHDQVEAMTLADRVLVMDKGRIEQVGPPQLLYHEPVSRFVAGFIGSPGMNFLPCRLETNGQGFAVVLSDGTRLPVPTAKSARYASHVGHDLELGLRPEHLTEPRGRAEEAELRVSVEVVEPMGMETLLHVLIAGSEATARVDPMMMPNPGETIAVAANMANMHLLDPTTGKVL
jgi:multiple sugar transport system ATP-binding protein